MPFSTMSKISNCEPKKFLNQLDIKEMNKDKTMYKNEDAIWNNDAKKSKFNMFPSLKSLEDTVVTGQYSGQSISYLKNSENDIKAKFFGQNWESKSKSEPNIFEDFGF